MPAKLSAAPRIAPKVSTATEMHSRHLSHLVVRKRDTTAPTTGTTRSCLYQKDGLVFKARKYGLVFKARTLFYHSILSARAF